MKRIIGIAGLILAVFSMSLPAYAVPPAQAPSPTVPRSPSEQAYINVIMPILSDYADSLDAFSDLMRQASLDLTLIRDNNWIIQIAAQFAIWRISLDTLLEIEAPERFAPVHEKLLEAAQHYADASFLVAEGIDEIDADKITQGTEEINMATEAVNEANALLLIANTTPSTAPPTPTRPVTPTRTPTATPTRAIIGTAIVNAANMNVRAGPGTNFQVIGTASTGTQLDIIGQNADGSWLNICCVNGQEGWVSASLVTVQVTPTPAATATPTATPTRAPVTYRLPVTVTLPMPELGQTLLIPLVLDFDVLDLTGAYTITAAGVLGIGEPVAVTSTPTRSPSSTSTAVPARTRTATPTPAGQCDPSYPDVCIPSPPPDLGCSDIPYRKFRVTGDDPHRFDVDGNGLGCEA